MYGKVNILTWYAELKHIGATLVYRMHAVRFVLSTVATYKYFVSKVRNIPFLSMNLWSLNSNHNFKVLPEHIGKCTCPAAINRALHVTQCGRINRRALPGNSVFTPALYLRAHFQPLHCTHTLYSLPSIVVNGNLFRGNAVVGFSR